MISRRAIIAKSVADDLCPRVNNRRSAKMPSPNVYHSIHESRPEPHRRRWRAFVQRAITVPSQPRHDGSLFHGDHILVPVRNSAAARGLLPCKPAHPLLQRRSISYWPFILEDISALCSWKRSARRAWVAMVFCTQRATQPFSRDETALDVKSSTQDMKQLSTRLPKSYTHGGRRASLSVRFPGGQARGSRGIELLSDVDVHRQTPSLGASACAARARAARWR